MDLLANFLNVLFTFFLLYSLAWTYFACGFALYDFKKGGSVIWNALGTAFWYGLFALPIIFCYLLWSNAASIIELLGSFFLIHSVFWVIFAKRIFHPHH